MGEQMLSLRACKISDLEGLALAQTLCFSTSLAPMNLYGSMKFGDNAAFAFANYLRFTPSLTSLCFGKPDTQN